MKKTLLIFFLILLNYAEAQHFSQKELTKTYGYQDVKYADINNDGVLDIVTLGVDVSYYLGLGNNNYGMKHLLEDTLYTSVITSGRTVLLNDLDHNGFIDIVYPHALANKIYIQFNNNLTFRKDSLNNVPELLGNIQMIDQNLDGEMDILTSYSVFFNFQEQKRMGLYLNNGNGEFNNGGELNSSGDNFNAGSELVDYNNDGIYELFSPRGGAQYSYNYCLHQFNDAPIASTLALPHPIPSFARDGAFMDIDEDGLQDFIFALDGFPNSIHWHDVNDLSITGYTEVTVPSRPIAEKVHCADINGDGRKDFLLCTNTDIHWYTVSTTGNFNYEGVLFSGIDVGPLQDIQVFDVNNDGLNDLIIVGNEALWHVLSNQNYQFNTKKEILRNIFSPNYFKVVDLNNDGLKDLLYNSGYLTDNGLIWQKNLGNNRFSEEIVIGRTNFEASSNFEVNDMDNDGDIDIIMGGSLMINNVYNSDKLAILFNDGLGGFNNRMAIESSSVIGITIGDFNNDGHKDIATLSNGNTGFFKTKYFMNNGNASSFSIQSISLDAIPKYYIDNADMNGDGKNDLIVDYDGKLMIYLNVGNSFSLSNNILLNRKQSAFRLGDFDNDGDKDIIKANWEINASNPSTYMNNYVFLKNNGLGQFIDSSSIESIADLNQNVRSVRVFDYNQDNKLDFFAMVDNNIYYYKNLGNGVFAIPSELMYTSIYNWNNIEVADIHNDGRNEIIYANESHGFIRSMNEVFTGSTPVFSQNTMNVCPGQNFQIIVQNATELNENTAWGLYSTSCDGNLLQTSTTGIFTLSSYYPTTYYVKAINGIPFSGNCSQFTITINSGITAPNLISTENGSHQIDLDWSSSNPNVTGWEYSSNDGNTWLSLPSTQNSVSIYNLNPNTCYDVQVRAIGNSGSCSINPSANSTICLPCQNYTTYDTAIVCRESHFIFPDGSFATYMSASETRLCQFQSVFGCDSLVYFTAYVPDQSYSFIQDTICIGTDYTFVDGTSMQNIQSDVSWSAFPVNNFGCTDWVNYFIVVISNGQIDSSYQICQNESLTFGDGNSFTNIQQDFTYSYGIPSGGDCDIPVNITVDVLPVYQLNTTEIICFGSDYTFPDGNTINNITDTVTYTMYLQTLNGCDSTIQITLNFPPTETEVILDTICQGSTYSFENGSFTINVQANIDTLITTNIGIGCSYSQHFIIEVIPVITLDSTLQLCQYSDYTFADGVTFHNIQTNFQHSYSIPSSNGCNDIVNMHIIVNSVSDITIYDSICQGEIYDFYGENITSPGVYSTTLQSISNCDSLITLSLIVNDCNAGINILESDELFLFPNPTRSIVNCSRKIDYCILNTNGQRIQIGKNQTQFNLENYESGVYIIEIKEKDLVVKRERIIKL